MGLTKIGLMKRIGIVSGRILSEEEFTVYEMNSIFNDLLTILDEVETQVSDGKLKLTGNDGNKISANNIAYIRSIVAMGATSSTRERDGYAVH